MVINPKAYSETIQQRACSDNKECRPEILTRQEDIKGAKEGFRRLWLNVTDDNYLTLYGYRRFRTTHLLNLRFLEDEIAKIDHQIFQAGMKLGYPPTAVDRLGLKHGKRDVNPSHADKVVDQTLILRLRDLLKQYGMWDQMGIMKHSD